MPAERSATVRPGSAPKGSSPPWNPMPTGSVHSLAVANGVVYMGGSFSQMGGQSRSNIAAVDATSGALLGWNPGASGTVSSLAVSADQTTDLRRWLVRQPRRSAAGEPGRRHRIDRRCHTVESERERTGGRRRASWVARFRRRRLHLRRRRSAVQLCCHRHEFCRGHQPGAGDRRTRLRRRGDRDTVYLGGAFSTLAGASRTNLGAVSRATGATTGFNPGTNNA